MSRTVAVVGAGITGLSAAYALLKAGTGDEVWLLEGSGRLGGKILTDSSGGLDIEAGPDSFITAKPWGLQLVRELGLEGDLLPTHPTKKDIFLYTRGKLRKYPDGLMLMAPAKILPFLASDLVPFQAKLRMGFDFLAGKGDPAIDESIGQFTRRRFGAEALEAIVGPIMAGIYSGDPDRLSLKSTFPQFREIERKHRSIILGLRRAAAAGEGRRKLPEGMTMFMTLKGGLRRIVERLHQKLPSGCVKKEHPVETLSKTAEGRWRLGIAGGRALEADAVILTAPANKAAPIVQNLDAGIAGEMRKIPFASTATASFAYPAEGFPHPLDGFGFVVDRREAKTVVAGTYSSTKFPGKVPVDKVLIRCFLGGVGREHTLEGPDETVLSAVRADLKEMMGLDAKPAVSRLFRWPEASPQYNVGHEKMIAGMEAKLAAHPGLILAGSSYRGVGIPDCVKSGRAAADFLAGNKDAVPDGRIF